jgi:hypothetical protein
MEQRHSASSTMPSTGTSPRHMGQIFKCVVSDASFNRSMPRRVTGYAVGPVPTASRDAGGSPWLHENLARIGYLHNTRLVLRLCYGRVALLLQDRLRAAGPQPPPSAPRDSNRPTPCRGDQRSPAGFSLGRSGAALAAALFAAGQRRDTSSRHKVVFLEPPLAQTPVRLTQVDLKVC